MDTINVEIVTPQKRMVAAEAAMVTLPGIEGEMGVLAKHAPLITLLKNGKVTLQSSESNHHYFVSEGFAEVTKERCTILAEFAADLSDVTLESANAQLSQAEDALNFAPDAADKTALQETVERFKSLVDVVAANS